MRKAIIITTVVLLTVLLFSACKGDTQSNPDAVIEKINGKPITQAELDYFSYRMRSEVMQRFIADYSMKYTEGFWQTEVNGTTPEKELRELALMQCRRAKLELALCQENGIYEDISFAALKQKAMEFNASNEGKSGVVGITSIDLDSFYTYYLETGVMELKNILEKSILAPSELEIIAQIAQMKGNSTEPYDEALRPSATDAVVESKYTKMIDELMDNAVITQ